MADVYDDVAKELAAQEREFFPVDLDVNASKYVLWRSVVTNLFNFIGQYKYLGEHAVDEAMLKVLKAHQSRADMDKFIEWEKQNRDDDPIGYYRLVSTAFESYVKPKGFLLKINHWDLSKAKDVTLDLEGYKEKYFSKLEARIDGLKPFTKAAKAKVKRYLQMIVRSDLAWFNNDLNADVFVSGVLTQVRDAHRSQQEMQALIDKIINAPLVKSDMPISLVAMIERQLLLYAFEEYIGEPWRLTQDMQVVALIRKFSDYAKDWFNPKEQN